MAIVPTLVRKNDVEGNLRRTVTDVTLDTSYPTGGYAITPAQLSLQFVTDAICQIKTTAAAGAAVEAFYDEVNGKIKLNAAAAEVANGSNVSTLVVRVWAYGGGT